MDRIAINYVHTEIVPIGPSLPIGMRKQIEARTHYEVTGAIEEGWRKLEPQIPGKISVHTKAPIGTMGSHPLTGFLNRIAEINAIAATQHVDLELSTVNQELAATGLASYSLSSSPIDDDGRGDIADTGSVGTEYTVVDPNIVRRIEWERYVKGCSIPRKAYLSSSTEILPDGTKKGHWSIYSKSYDVGTDLLREMAKRLKSAIGERTPADLDNDRARAEHYGVGSGTYGVWTGEQVELQSMDSDQTPTKVVLVLDEDEPDALVTESVPVEDRDGGPVELGLHVLTVTGPRFEPSESFYWDRQDATNGGETIQRWA